MNITVRDLLDAGVHFGHQIRRWNPRSKPFIHDHRHGVSIIDLEKTYQQLEIATQFIEETVAKGKDVLFVGTKKQAKDIIREAAVNVHMPFSVNRWMGGTLTNFVTIKSSLAKYHKFLEMETDGRLAKLPGKESAAIRRQMERMFRNFEGLKEVRDIPAAMFVVDIKSEQIAVAEARILGIPVVGLVDTNSDPTLVDYPIPGNDDAVKSIRLIVETISEAVQNGLARRSTVVESRGFTPRMREEQEDNSHETGVTLPEGYEEFGDRAAVVAPVAPVAAAVEEVAVEAPVVEEPAVEAPAVEDVAVEEPAAEEPAAEEVAVEEPTTEFEAVTESEVDTTPEAETLTESPAEATPEAEVAEAESEAGEGKAKPAKKRKATPKEAAPPKADEAK